MYKWKIRHIGFNKGLMPAPNGEEIEFKDKDTFDKWFKNTSVGLAQLDEVMNFCQYFVREKGNDGKYVREGKTFPVNGEWTGIQDMWCKHEKDNSQWVCCKTKPFCAFLKENGWEKDWFKLHERYAQTS